MNPHLTSGLDVALLVLWAFALFFLCLVFYLRREDRREGYPVEDELTGRIDTVSGPLSMAKVKSFLLPFGHGLIYKPELPSFANGRVVGTPPDREPVTIAAKRTDRFAGAPYAPTGNPLVDGIGPAAWADRAKRPDIDMEGHPRIVPLSLATGYSVASEDPDLIGWPMIGADGEVAGRIEELWIDRADRLIRYMQVSVGDGDVLAPMMMAKVDRRRRRVVIDALLASQFAGAPRIEATDQITLYEEDRVQGYFGGGYLYATPARQEPLL